METSKLATSKDPISVVWLLVLGIAWLILGGFIIFNSFAQPASIDITWQTESEFETAGFNIYRSTSPDGDFEQINPQLIPSQADPASGASYTFTDNNVVGGITYYYLLEDVEYDNDRIQHDEDIIVGQIARLDWIRIALVTISFLAGLGLLATGIREIRQL